MQQHVDTQLGGGSFASAQARTDRLPAEAYGEDDVDTFITENQRYTHDPADETTHRRLRLRLIASFFLFGVLNNIIYVLILSSALDLVPSTTPAGLVAFINIFPSLLTKLLWPYLSTGAIRYTCRVITCTLASWAGMILISGSNTTSLRLLGIGIASFSSGFGEMTFLQLTTTLPTASQSRDAIGAWSSGTGGAGIGGAASWWGLRSLGVRRGLAIASFLPCAFPGVYFFLLPALHRARLDAHPGVGGDEYTVVSHSQPIFAVEEEEDDDDDEHPVHTARKVVIPTVPYNDALSTLEKIQLVKPLLVRYMLPLFLVYAFEYIINTGVAPTLAFPPPTTGAWSLVFRSIRDYYPFWSLTYQTFVFISRSALTLGLPALPKRLLYVPAACQAVILTLLSLQASRYIFSSADARPRPSAYDTNHHGGSVGTWWSWLAGLLHSASSQHDTDQPGPPGMGMGNGTNHLADRAITVVFLLICLEGLMGGTGYCMTYYHIGREGEDDREDDHAREHEYERLVGSVLENSFAGRDKAKRKARKEFRMAAAGAADSLGIVFASLISMPVQVSLCNTQVKAGSTICKQL